MVWLNERFDFAVEVALVGVSTVAWLATGNSDFVVAGGFLAGLVLAAVVGGLWIASRNVASSTAGWRA
jgi:energy-converting hydrogenase Eha subunit H